MKRVYIDGVFDLFHRGHLESLIQAKNVYGDPDNTELIVGVVSDSDCKSYKRQPIINENDRTEIIKALKIVNQVIFPAPLIMTMEFVNINNIDIVVHSFSDDNDRNKQKPFYQELMDNNKFKEISYYSKVSTTELIKKMKIN